MDGAKLDDAARELKPLGWSREALELGAGQDFKCFYCKRDLLASIEDFDVWHFDHVIPVSKMGTDDIANKVVACKLCNFVKRNFDPRSTAREGATLEELRAIATEHVAAGLKEKKARLDKFNDVLLRTGLIRPERAKGSGAK